MSELFAALGIDAPRFLKAAFEVSLLGLFVACLVHSLATHGWHRTLREFVAGFGLTLLAESTGVLSGAYVYPGFHFYLLATPIANPASWVATVYVVIEVSNRLVYGRRALDAARLPLLRGRLVPTLAALALLDATLALAIDIVMDPLATVYNWWVWVPCAPGVTTVGPGVVDPYNFEVHRFLTTPPTSISAFFAGFFPAGMRYPTRVLGIPLINFIAWLVFVFVFAFQFRWVEAQDTWGQARRTGVLWALMLADVPVLALVLIAPNL